MISTRIAASALAALSALALLCGGCGGSPSPVAAPITTVEIPSQQGPEAKTSLEPEPSEPREPSEPEPDSNSSSVFGNKAVSPESPPFVARFAAVFRSPASSAQPSFFGGDSIVLFTSRVTCDVAAVDQAGPPRLRLSVAWAAGQRSSFQQFVMKNGQASKNAGSIEVVSAPPNKGDVGRVLVDATQGGNVTGGEIDALVCE